MVPVRGLDPVAGPDARVLILGLLPSEESISKNQYYAFGQNCFWRVVEGLFAASHELEYRQRTELLIRSRVAVWDVARQAERDGSMDAAIVPESVVANDVAGFLDLHLGINAICFNGGESERLFRRHIEPTIAGRPGLRLIRLPSTSSANTHMTFDQKLEKWRIVAEVAAESWA